MNLKKLLLFFFLAALASISLGSVALGSTEERRAADSSPGLNGETWPFVLTCNHWDDDHDYDAYAAFWWTKDGARVGEKGDLHCHGDHSSDIYNLPVPMTRINDFHLEIVLVHEPTGQQNICRGDYKFPTDTTPDSQDLLPVEFEQECSLPGFFSGHSPPYFAAELALPDD